MWGGGTGFYSDAASKRVRKKAEDEYDRQRNLRPVGSPPPSLIEALEAAAAEVGVVRWVTLGEYRGDNDTVSRLLVGVRRAPGAPGGFEAVEAAFSKAVGGLFPRAPRVEVIELDADVDVTMADGTENPYVVLPPRG